MTAGKLALLIPLAIVGMIVFITIGGGIVMLLWNWLLPPLFGWQAIGLWQALGLLALCRILFGGFGFHGTGRSRVRRRIEERCEEVAPEIRERIRRRMRERYGMDPSGGESGES
jgi:hypothetical protein